MTLGHPKPAKVVKEPKPLRRSKPPARTRMKAKRKHAHPAWRKLREQALYRDKGWCQVCDEQEAVEVHHLSYGKGRGVKSLLVELDQLVSVCRRCPEAQHPWMKREAA